MAEYIRCPRCELNFIKKKDKYCSVCKAELSADPNAFDDLELEICPICKTNFIRPDEIMCTTCAKERNLTDIDAGDEEWETYVNPEEEVEASVEEETGEIAHVTDLDADDDIEDIEADDEDDLPEIDEEFDEEEEEDDEEADEEEEEDDDFDYDEDFDEEDEDDEE